jgi:hypothetical protein
LGQELLDEWLGLGQRIGCPVRRIEPLDVMTNLKAVRKEKA